MTIKFILRRPAVGLLLALLLAPRFAEAQDESCTFIQIVMDESGSMETEQAFLREEAMPEVIGDLQIKYNQKVLVCTWGFGWLDKGKYVLS